MGIKEINEYEVILRNGEEKCIVADGFNHIDDSLCFLQEHEIVAWFNPHEIIGYRKVIEYVLDDSETIDETAVYGEEQDNEHTD